MQWNWDAIISILEPASLCQKASETGANERKPNQLEIIQNIICQETSYASYLPKEPNHQKSMCLLKRGQNLTHAQSNFGITGPKHQISLTYQRLPHAIPWKSKSVYDNAIELYAI